MFKGCPKCHGDFIAIGMYTVRKSPASNAAITLLGLKWRGYSPMTEYA